MSSQADKDRVRALDRIKKLLAVAKDKAANEHEAQNAANMAAKLMAKYNVEFADLIMAEIKAGVGDSIVEVVVEDTNYRKRIPTYYNVLVTGVAEVLECVSVYRPNMWNEALGEPKPTMLIRGFKDDVVVAIWLCVYVLRQMDDLATQSWRENVLPDLQERGVDVHASRRKSYKENYKFGVIQTLLPRIQEVHGRAQFEAEAESAHAAESAQQLATVKRTAIERVFGEMKPTIRRVGGQDMDAIVAGMNDSSKVNINRVVSQDQLSLPHLR